MLKFEEFKTLRGESNAADERSYFDVASLIDTFTATADHEIADVKRELSRSKDAPDFLKNPKLVEGALVFALLNIQQYNLDTIQNDEESRVLGKLSRSLFDLYLNLTTNPQEKYRALILATSSWLEKHAKTSSNPESAETLRCALYTTMKIAAISMDNVTYFQKLAASAMRIDIDKMKTQISEILTAMEAPIVKKGVAAPRAQAASKPPISKGVGAGFFSPLSAQSQQAPAGVARRHTHALDLLKEVSSRPPRPKRLTADDIEEAVKIAKTNYSAWYNGAAGRGASQCFDRVRHTQAGQDKASALYSQIRHQKLKNMEEIIDTFLSDPKTGYRRHSFASYLLDELRKLEGSRWTGITAKPDGLYNAPALSTTPSPTTKGPA